MSDNSNLATLVPASIEGQMKESYLDYAMSVIVSRALPDCRDGMKPVHRRILYAMHEMNNYHDKPYKKSARVVGEVIGKYHPHGDAPIYMSLVRMAQDFSLRMPLIDGQGNFGSMDGDSPAQMRYTEARLAKISSTILANIDQDTVDFQDNYDGSETEPKVLPAQFPNLLVNGTSGIAVGMATSIPTHNLGEVLDACCAFAKNENITMEELLEYVPAPDFPTGGIILGYGRPRTALASGRGSLLVRGAAAVEELGGKDAIIITEIPYQVNKAELVKKVEELSKEKTIEGISEIRDETNKLGVRIVVELKRGVIGDVILNQLYKFTALQTSISYNMLALNEGMPMLMNLQSVISTFVKFREEVVTRRITFLLNKARTKAHVLIGLSLAVANIDEVISLIRSSADINIARERLMERSWDAHTVIPLLKLVDDYRNELQDGQCYFTHEQAKAILEMRLSRLTGLEKEKIDGELNELATEIAKHLEVLRSREMLYDIIIKEFETIREKFASPRKTKIEMNEAEVDMEDLIQREEMVVITTVGGYIKRVPLSTYRAQKRGGKGRSAMNIHEEDVTANVSVISTHTPLLFFSDRGQVYRMKVYKLPLGSPQSKGRSLVNLLPLASDEKITTITPMPEDTELWDKLSIMFATAKGNIRRSELAAFSNINANGKIAIRLDAEDKLIEVKICNHDDHILLCTKNGKSLRCAVNSIRVVKSRTSDGVRGIKLTGKDDEIISMSILKGIEFSTEKRDEFLRIPIGARLKFAETGDAEELEQRIANSETALEKLTLAEAQEFALQEQFILAITENGYGKRTSAYEYRAMGRGGSGMLNIDTSARNGYVISTFPVDAKDEIMLMTDKGIVIRTNVSDIRITGRNASGVILFNTAGDQKVISATHIKKDSEDELEQEQINDNENGATESE